MIQLWLLVLVCVLTSNAYIDKSFRLAKIQRDRQLFMSNNLVALTRETGSNSELKKLLAGIDCLTLPCLKFENLPLKDKCFMDFLDSDATVITSPQAAKVFADVIWKRTKKMVESAPKFISVGSGTTNELKSRGFKIVFEPSDATAACLAKECPLELGPKLFYPASALASKDLEKGLKERGFTVRLYFSVIASSLLHHSLTTLLYQCILQVFRANTYNTLPTEWTETDLARARTCSIATFTSPSAVRNWVAKVGNSATAVVIGPTTEQAALSEGFTRVLVPPDGSKGLKPFAELIRETALSTANDRSLIIM